MGCNGNPSCRCMKMAGLDVLASWAETKRNGSFIIKYRLRMYGDHCRVLEFVPTPQCFSVLVKPLCENNWLLFELIMGRTQCEHKERKLKPQRNTDESSKESCMKNTWHLRAPKHKETCTLMSYEHWLISRGMKLLSWDASMVMGDTIGS